MRRLNLVMSLLLDDIKKMTDEGREIPVRWSVMHMYSCAQLAKILALHRGIKPELAGMAAALHDIAIIYTGKTENHAELSVKYVHDFINRLNSGSWSNIPKTGKEETDILVRAITGHSRKDKDSKEPLTELLKDVDTLDRYLHGVKETRKDYIERFSKVLNELGIEQLDIFKEDGVKYE